MTARRGSTHCEANPTWTRSAAARKCWRAYGPDQDLAGAGIAYGRVVSTAGEGFFLQYWLFYPDNPCVLPPGRHDGDWELVQVKASATGDGFAATQVTLAGHGKPVTRRSTRPARRGPDVFVAVDSHACLLRGGSPPCAALRRLRPRWRSRRETRGGAAAGRPDKRDWVHWPGAGA